jgi:hypothetical protein
MKTFHYLKMSLYKIIIAKLKRQKNIQAIHNHPLVHLDLLLKVYLNHQNLHYLVKIKKSQSNISRNNLSSRLNYHLHLNLMN